MISSEGLVEKILSCPTLPMIPGTSVQVLQLTEDSQASAQRSHEIPASEILSHFI
jgi:hypothetical protein